MKKKRYTDEQIAYALRQAESGTPIVEVCRKLGVSEATFYNWRSKFAGNGSGGAARAAAAAPRESQAQAARRGPVARQAHAAGGDLKKALKPARKRELVRFLGEGFRISERRDCRLLQFARSVHRYESHRPDDTELRHRIRELAAARPRFGYRRIWVLLRREGRFVNLKKVYRLYTEEDLAVQTKRRRKRASHLRIVLPAAEAPNERCRWTSWPTVLRMVGCFGFSPSSISSAGSARFSRLGSR